MKNPYVDELNSWAMFAGLPAEPLPVMDRPALHNVKPKRLAGHRRGECLWPLGAAEAIADWRTLFCCAPVQAGCSYCPSHAGRAFQPPADAAPLAAIGALR